jgi:Tat protein secretion system quality control protein TatD with DNase activity
MTPEGKRIKIVTKTVTRRSQSCLGSNKSKDEKPFYTSLGFHPTAQSKELNQNFDRLIEPKISLGKPFLN